MKPAEILIVDDHEVVRAQLVNIFENLNYVVDQRANGQEAIDAVRRHCPDVIIMDLRMPLLDGLTATKLIREMGGRYATVPIMAISAGGQHLEADALNAGCTGYFRKEQTKDLVHAITEILKQRKSTDT